MITKVENNIAKSEMVRQALKFWFADQGHIRSPFPEYIQVTLQKRSVQRFSEWLEKLNEKAKDEVNEEILAEKFEEFLFESGLELVETEDERITLLYPFLPRLGDEVTPPSEGLPHKASQVAGRTLSAEGDIKFLTLHMKELESNTQWETKMELPA